MANREEMIAKLQADDKRQEMIAKLEADDAAKHANEPNFAPGPVVQLQVDIPLWKRALGGVVAMGNTIGGQQVGAAVDTALNDKSYDENLAQRSDEAKAQKALDPATYALGASTAKALPALATGGAGLMAQGAAMGASGAFTEAVDPTQDPNTAGSRAIKTGLIDGGLTLAGGALIKGAAGASSKLAQTQAGGKVVSGLKAMARKFGMSETEAVIQAEQLAAGRARPSTNELEATRLMKDTGILNDNPTFEVLYPRLEGIRATHGPVVDQLTDEATSAGITKYFNAKDVIDDLISSKRAAPGGAEKKIQALIAESGVGGNMTPRQLLDAKRIFGNEYGDLLKTQGASKLDIAAKKALYGYTNDLLDQAVAKPAFTEANRLLTAAQTFEDFVRPAYDAGKVGGSAVMRGAKTLMSTSNPVKAAGAAISGNVSSPGALNTTKNVIRGAASTVEPVAQFIQKITNPAVVLATAKQVWAMKNIPVIERSKYIKALFVDGTPPPNLTPAPAQATPPMNAAQPVIPTQVTPAAPPPTNPMETFKKSR